MRKNKGFTLVELLVVMSIIAILAVIALAAFRSTQARSRDAQRKSDLKEISHALEMFYSDHRVYPLSNPSGTGEIMACVYDLLNPGSCGWGVDEMSDGSTIYFRKLPADPINSQQYYYRAINDQQAYQIYAHLENKEDKNCFEDANGDPECLVANPNLPIQSDSCGGLCNFAITSPNVTPFDTGS